MNKVFRGICAAGMMSLPAVTAHAQNPPVIASLGGRVVDSSGIGIPDVEVTLRDSRFAVRNAHECEGRVHTL
jgi:hypothetical protein